MMPNEAGRKRVEFKCNRHPTGSWGWSLSAGDGTGVATASPTYEIAVEAARQKAAEHGWAITNLDDPEAEAIRHLRELASLAAAYGYPLVSQEAMTAWNGVTAFLAGLPTGEDEG